MSLSEAIDKTLSSKNNVRYLASKFISPTVISTLNKTRMRQNIHTKNVQVRSKTHAKSMPENYNLNMEVNKNINPAQPIFWVVILILFFLVAASYG
jgi:hypothetical protein